MVEPEALAPGTASDVVRPSLLLSADTFLCALDIRYVGEVMRPLPVRPAPGSPPFVRGLSVIRGTATPVVGLGALLGGDGRGSHRYVTVRGGRHPVALAVDSVLGIREVDGASLEGVSTLVGATSQAAPVVGVVEAEPLWFLDGTHLVPESTWQSLAAPGMPP
jgi:purine-binding chemotaxis protein CheW